MTGRGGSTLRATAPAHSSGQPDKPKATPAIATTDTSGDTTSTRVCDVITSRNPCSNVAVNRCSIAAERCSQRSSIVDIAVSTPLMSDRVAGSCPAGVNGSRYAADLA